MIRLVKKFKNKVQPFAGLALAGFTMTACLNGAVKSSNLRGDGSGGEGLSQMSLSSDQLRLIAGAEKVCGNAFASFATFVPTAPDGPSVQAAWDILRTNASVECRLALDNALGSIQVTDLRSEKRDLQFALLVQDLLIPSARAEGDGPTGRDGAGLTTGATAKTRAAAYAICVASKLSEKESFAAAKEFANKMLASLK